MLWPLQWLQQHRFLLHRPGSHPNCRICVQTPGQDNTEVFRQSRHFAASQEPLQQEAPKRTVVCGDIQHASVTRNPGRRPAGGGLQADFSARGPWMNCPGEHKPYSKSRVIVEVRGLGAGVARWSRWTWEVASCSVPTGGIQAPETVGAEGEKEDRVVSNPAPMAAPELRPKKTEQNRSRCRGLETTRNQRLSSHKGLLWQRKCAWEGIQGSIPGGEEPWTQVSSSQTLLDLSLLKATQP
ncbi:phospholipase A2 group V isoform X2 [Cricetulus griseus]|uniref:Phospholipase A2 group V isoform X2 n=1 Tax=Cricetulus griseus TaxID=10029 RepID=A0A9J7GN25_CRIGR|nr:phospholipase A2 group V isoform X2 [Cricetulus griseus]